MTENYSEHPTYEDLAVKRRCVWGTRMNVGCEMTLSHEVETVLNKEMRNDHLMNDYDEVWSVGVERKHDHVESDVEQRSDVVERRHDHDIAMRNADVERKDNHAEQMRNGDAERRNDAERRKNDAERRRNDHGEWMRNDDA